MCNSILRWTKSSRHHCCILNYLLGKCCTICFFNLIFDLIPTTKSWHPGKTKYQPWIIFIVDFDIFFSGFSFYDFVMAIFLFIYYTVQTLKWPFLLLLFQITIRTLGAKRMLWTIFPEPKVLGINCHGRIGWCCLCLRRSCSWSKWLSWSTYNTFNSIFINDR